jgi:pimeloyl-ACP methyl ester carboxylesterase
MSTIEEQIRAAEGRLFARYDVSLTEHLLDLKVEGSALRIRVLEAGSGPPVVLLHPAFWFAAQWVPLLSHIPNRRLLCVDLPGHGLSGEVDYRKHDLRHHTVAMLRQLWSELGLAATPVLGNSLGGMAALHLAFDEPSLVSHVVIFGQNVALPGGRIEFIPPLLTLPGVCRLLLSLPSSPKLSRTISKPALGPAALAQTPEEMFEIHYLASRRPEVARSLSTLLRAVLRWRTVRPNLVLAESELAGLIQRVRFIWGKDDMAGGPEIGERAAELMRDAAIAIYPGGHCQQLDDPERCGKFVSEFLSDSIGTQTPAEAATGS